MSWLSRKVTARDGHQPATPGGLPCASFSRQYSFFSSASCSTACEDAQQLSRRFHRKRQLPIFRRGIFNQALLCVAGSVITSFTHYSGCIQWPKCSSTLRAICSPAPLCLRGVRADLQVLKTHTLTAHVHRGMPTFVVKSKAVDDPAVASHQSTIACRSGSQCGLRRGSALDHKEARLSAHSSLVTF